MTDFMVQQGETPVPTASQRRAARLSNEGKATVPPEPSRDAIARRAYEIYVKTGSPEGHFEESWRQAEQDLHHECQGKCGSPKCGCDKLPAPHICSEPVEKALASASPSRIGGSGSTCGSAPSVPTGGRNNQAQPLLRLAT